MRISAIAMSPRRVAAYAVAMDTLTTAIRWFASISGMIAAFMVAADYGRRTTGWGFVLFLGSSVAWIAGAVLAGDGALGTQNAVLFAINLFGVYRYLIRRTGV